MDERYRRIGDKVNLHYDQPYSVGYRESDESEIVTENHKYICNILKDICKSFGKYISVLDLGCGTGRYFHCLRNVETLTGIDISPHMLEKARNPVRESEITINHVNLICSNVFELEITEESFDFIYSIGVLGEHSPFDHEICGNLFGLLKPGGKLLFTAVDISTKIQAKSLKRRIAEMVIPLLPEICTTRIRERLMSNYMTEKEVREVLKNSHFVEYEISRHVSTSPRWKGAHHVCLAIKDKASILNQ